jgi:hypothetical protein
MKQDRYSITRPAQDGSGRMRATEDAIATACEQVVGGVGKDARQPTVSSTGAPRPAQLPGDACKRVALAVGVAALDQQHRFERLDIESVVTEQRLPERRLGGRELDRSARVLIGDEAHGARAQHAHAVEHQQRARVVEPRHGPSPRISRVCSKAHCDDHRHTCSSSTSVP